MNGSLVTQATTLEDSMTLRAVVEAPFLKDAEKLDTLFLAAYSRLPRADERERFLKVVRAKPGRRGPAAGVREHLLGAAQQPRIRALSVTSVVRSLREFRTAMTVSCLWHAEPDPDRIEGP